MAQCHAVLSVVISFLIVTGDRSSLDRRSNVPLQIRLSQGFERESLA
jgi:hypothetical protein